MPRSGDAPDATPLPGWGPGVVKKAELVGVDTLDGTAVREFIAAARRSLADAPSRRLLAHDDPCASRRRDGGGQLMVDTHGEKVARQTAILNGEDPAVPGSHPYVGNRGTGPEDADSEAVPGSGPSSGNRGTGQPDVVAFFYADVRAVPRRRAARRSRNPKVLWRSDGVAVSSNRGQVNLSLRPSRSRREALLGSGGFFAAELGGGVARSCS